MYSPLARAASPWVAALTALVVAGQSSATDAPIATALDIMESGRPAGLFKIAYGANDNRCQAIAAELNKPSEYDSSYWERLTFTSFEVAWQLLAKETQEYRDSLAEFARADIYNDGSPVFVFRIHGMIHSRENHWLAAAGPSGTTPDVVTATRSLLVDGAFDIRHAVPLDSIYNTYPAVVRSLGLTRGDFYGYPLFNILSFKGTTYIVEGNAYEFVDPDFIWVHIGHPDRSFSLACVFDPQLVIPKNPPDIYYQ